MQELDDYINRVKHLPPAPKILPQLLTLLNQPDSDSGQVVDLISLDPSLTAGVLKLCNSAFFAGGSPASDIQEAITRLGFRQVFQLVASISGARALSPPQKGYGIDAGELWQHSVTSAVASQMVAMDQGEDDNIVFTASLLHDLGKIVLAEALEHIYAKLIEEIETHQYSLLETEKKLLGVQHAEIGGRLLSRWKFPPEMVAAVWHHHLPAAAQEHARLAAYVYVGNMIAYFMGHGYGHQAFALRGRSEALDILQLNADALPRYMIRTFEKMEMIKTLFRGAK
jgi:putative nucleotidyltransferase with HDIG domain